MCCPYFLVSSIALEYLQYGVFFSLLYNVLNQIKAVIPELINNDQIGFLHGRFIEENIRLIDNIIDYTSEKKYSRRITFYRFWESLWLTWMAICQTYTWVFWFWPLLDEMDSNILL